MLDGKLAEVKQMALQPDDESQHSIRWTSTNVGDKDMPCDGCFGTSQGRRT
jgi:hypothetical protein